MTHSLSLRKRLLIGFGSITLLAALISTVSVLASRSMMSKSELASEMKGHQQFVGRMVALIEGSASSRGELRGSRQPGRNDWASGELDQPGASANRMEESLWTSN